MQKRGGFSSRLGIVLATVGSAVGLGNVWRFPYELGDNGGGAFLIFYVIAILLLGFPALMAEFIIGRHSKANAVDSFRVLEPKKKWHLVGAMGILAGFLIMGFYTVVSGWTLRYLVISITGGLNDLTPTGYSEIFTSFSSSIYQPIAYLALVMFISHLIVRKGVNSGIEKMSSYLMPILFVLLAGLAMHSLTLDGAQEGLDFLFSFHFEDLKSDSFLVAMGQAFFTLSVGMGCLITYASYYKDDVNLTKTATQVISLDTLVAILAGVMIFPAVFSFDLEPSAGPGLVYIVLPNVFNQMVGGQFISIAFYLLLCIAAVTSLMSLHEVVTAYVHEKFNIKRPAASFIVTVLVVFIGVFASLSFGPLKDFTLVNKTVFDVLDYVTASILLPLGGLFTSFYVGWIMDKRALRNELLKSGSMSEWFFKVLIFLLKYITPTAILALFLFTMFGGTAG